MNICVTLNPCLDKWLEVPPWQPGAHQVRGTKFGQVVGGKGVNVARALARLSQPSRPALFLGGEIGLLCDRLLRQQDGFDPLVAWTEAPTREILTVRTSGTADQTAFFDPDPEILATERDDLTGQLQAAFSAGATWCAMSGSSPCPQTDDIYAALVRQARQANIRTLVDTYGNCLQPALEAGPDVVKINRRECEHAVGKTLETTRSIRDALAWILGYGVSFAAITLGPQGMVAAWKNHVVAWKPPPIDPINPIGAGDALAAGLIDALSRDQAPRRAFRWAMACAVCSVRHWVACDVYREEAEEMVDRIEEV